MRDDCVESLWLVEKTNNRVAIFGKTAARVDDFLNRHWSVEEPFELFPHDLGDLSEHSWVVSLSYTFFNPSNLHPHPSIVTRADVHAVRDQYSLQRNVYGFCQPQEAVSSGGLLC